MGVGPLAANQEDRDNLNPIEPLGVKPGEAARLIAASHSTVYRLIGTGDLIAIKRGGSTLVTLASIRAYREACPRVALGAGLTKPPRG